MLSVLFLILLIASNAMSNSLRQPTSFVSIRGNVGAGLSQSLPVSLTKPWKTWTFENGMIERVDDTLSTEDNVDGWVHPVSYDDLYLPSDLPSPRMQAAVGLVVINGSPRYAMPSLVLTLETPGRVWRNRGVCSLPRANSWVDLFGEYSNISRLKFYCFGQFAPDVRFLEGNEPLFAALCDNAPNAKLIYVFSLVRAYRSRWCFKLGKLVCTLRGNDATPDA